MSTLEYWVNRMKVNPLSKDEDFFIVQKQPCDCEIMLLMQQGCQCGGS